jgi:hypothetical protein
MAAPDPTRAMTEVGLNAVKAIAHRTDSVINSRCHDAAAASQPEVTAETEPAKMVAGVQGSPTVAARERSAGTITVDNAAASRAAAIEPLPLPITLMYGRADEGARVSDHPRCQMARPQSRAGRARAWMHVWCVCCDYAGFVKTRKTNSQSRTHGPAYGWTHGRTWQNRLLQKT